MESPSNKDNTATVEIKEGDDVTNTKDAEEDCHIFDRANMTAKEYRWLWTGILVQAFTFSFEICLIQAVMSYITAYFKSSSKGSILPTILQILAAALVPFYTKVSDVFGRAGSLTFAILSYMLGLIIEGTAPSFVQFAVGQVFYGMGKTGIQTLSQVLIADTTLLIDRGLIFALWDVGSVVNIWVAQVLIDPLTTGGAKDKWRISFVIMGVVCIVGTIALLVPLWYVQTKSAQRKGIKQQRKSIRWLLHELDAVGATLLTFGLSLTLLPMILAQSYEGNWRNSSILGMFLSGIVIFGILALWETKYTDRPIMSMKIWTNRTAFGGLMIIFLLKIMGNVNWEYFTLYLVVSRNITFGQAFMLVRGFQMSWLVFQILAGYLMKRYNTCRPIAWIGIIIYVIGVGLMIPARSPTASDAFVVISQTIAGAGGGMAHIAGSVVVTGVVHKKDVATVVGASQILLSLGSALGGAMAGGLWTQYLPGRLSHHITGEYNERLAMDDPLKYIPSLDPVTKSQLVQAYGDAQKLMSIICCATAVLACICTALMKHVDLRQDQETQDRIANGEDVSSQASETVEQEKK